MEFAFQVSAVTLTFQQLGATTLVLKAAPEVLAGPLGISDFRYIYLLVCCWLLK